MKSRSNQRLGTIPGSTGLPIIGNLPRLLPNPFPYVQELHEALGNVFYARFAFNQKAVFLLGPDAAEVVLQNRNQGFSNELGYLGQSRFLGPRNLLFRDGDEHRAIRQKMNAAFKPAALKTYLDVINKRIAERVSRWSEGTGETLADDIRRLALDVALEVIAGAEVGHDSDAIVAHYLDMLRAGSSVGPKLPGTAKWKGAKGRAYMDHFVRSRIAGRRRAPTPDLFTSICSADSSDALGDDDIVDNMIGLLVAAYETTANTMMMMVCALAEYPAWQERLRAEFTTTGTSEQVRFETLGKLVETDRVMNETLRLNPPLPFLPRRSLQAFEFEGHRIPKNTAIIVSPMFIHRMPSLYPNPNAFEPERFASTRAEDKVHPCAFIPFGKGPHTCMGMHFARMEVKSFFAHLLARFRIEVCPQHDLRMRYVPVHGPVGSGLPIRLCERAGR
jgi:cytochrome P450